MTLVQYAAYPIAPLLLSGELGAIDGIIRFRLLW